MLRIDSHHHFWNYSTDQYPWISESMSILKKDFLPPDLLAETESAYVEGVVSVQARQSVEETRWLLEMAKQHDWILGVVGWLPLANADVRATMSEFRNERKLCSLRHVVQDERDDGFLEQADFNAGVKAIQEFGWAYDLLVYSRQLPFVIPFVDRHPEQVFVMDHIAKPTIQTGNHDKEWEHNIRELAKRPNVFCKFSGVVTEVRDAQWTVSAIQPYWDVVANAFGSDRLMFGSDWPVCLLKSSYADWVAAASQFASKWSNTEQARFWSQNAIRAYQLR